MTKPRRVNPFEPPPHINAEPHRRLMARVKTMTADELFQVAVDVGIYTADGELTETYGGTAKDPTRAQAAAARQRQAPKRGSRSAAKKVEAGRTRRASSRKD